MNYKNSFSVSGFIKSLREVPTLLLMRLAFGADLCRFGMFRAVRSNEYVKIDYLEKRNTQTFAQ
ncbi:MAG: hypothetical protein KME29_34175 [Calothrix sp. FI2-JRJ7]|nr:hypothetical protein [Calothrix sp. FI2-JRJ7]